MTLNICNNCQRDFPIKSNINFSAGSKSSEFPMLALSSSVFELEGTNCTENFQVEGWGGIGSMGLGRWVFHERVGFLTHRYEMFYYFNRWFSCIGRCWVHTSHRYMGSQRWIVMIPTWKDIGTYFFLKGCVSKIVFYLTSWLWLRLSLVKVTLTLITS